MTYQSLPHLLIVLMALFNASTIAQPVLKGSVEERYGGMELPQDFDWRLPETQQGYSFKLRAADSCTAQLYYVLIDAQRHGIAVVKRNDYAEAVRDMSKLLTLKCPQLEVVSVIVAPGGPSRRDDFLRTEGWKSNTLDLGR